MPLTQDARRALRSGGSMFGLTPCILTLTRSRAPLTTASSPASPSHGKARSSSLSITLPSRGPPSLCPAARDPITRGL